MAFEQEFLSSIGTIQLYEFNIAMMSKYDDMAGSALLLWLIGSLLNWE